MARRSLSLLFAAMAAAVSVATPAKADAIDGDWCADDGRHFSIRGPAITTPGGRETTGNYSRHAFNYIPPEGEDSAGEEVGMLLLNENTVQVQASGQPEIWLRCKPAIS